MPGSVSNQNTNQQLPKPTMATITKQNMPDLDHNNRFFDDNKKFAQKFGPGYITVAKTAADSKPVEVSADADEKTKTPGQTDENA